MTTAATSETNAERLFFQKREAARLMRKASAALIDGIVAFMVGRGTTGRLEA